MTKELMQQSLDALNESIDCVRTECAVHVENYGAYPGWKVRLDVMKSGVDKHEAAIAALETIIAQPVPRALTDIDALAKLYCGSYASPHHITFTVEGLRNMIQAAIAQPGQQQGAV